MSESRKNEKVCAKCQRPFWSWESEKRTLCWVCAPLTPKQTAIFKTRIQDGTIAL